MSYAIEAAGVALWSWSVNSDKITMDERGFNLWGVPLQETVTFEDLSAHIHPQDLDRVRAAFAATRALKGAYEIDFRVMIGEDVRWISARGQGNDDGMRDRTMFGIFLNVTGRKQAEEAHELLSGEMSHRVKNLLQIATVLTSIASRSTKTAAEMAHDLSSRLMALGRAHNLVRPDVSGGKQAALLGDLIAVLLQPYEETGAFAGRIRVSVPKMAVREGAATALALVIHELATNSLKYGALSVPSGTLDISCTASVGDQVVIWTERGGPPVVAPTPPSGFGSKMVNRTMSRQLHGSIAFDWDKEGLIATLRMSKDSLMT